MTVHNQLFEEWESLKAENEQLRQALADCEAGGGGGGEEPPFHDLLGWDLLFSDDFTTDVPLGQFPQAVSAKWGAYPTSYKDTSKNGTYDPGRTISISNSVMRLHMHTTSDGIVRVSAPVPYIRPPSGSVKWPGQVYGRYAYRARWLAPAPGFKVAWLLWPDSGTNTSGSPSGTGGNGEIDFPEFDLAELNHVSGFMHRQDATVGNDQYQCSAEVDATQWHTYTVEWSPNLCEFFIDDDKIGSTTERVPYTAMHLVLQSETQLSGGKPAPDVVADIELDWVAIWSRA